MTRFYEGQIVRVLNGDLEGAIGVVTGELDSMELTVVRVSGWLNGRLVDGDFNIAHEDLEAVA